MTHDQNDTGDQCDYCKTDLVVIGPEKLCPLCEGRGGTNAEYNAARNNPELRDQIINNEQRLKEKREKVREENNGK